MLTLSSIIAAITALIIGAAGLWFGGKARAKDEANMQAQTDRAEDVAAAEKKTADVRVESVKVANDVKDEITRTTDDGVRDKLRGKWTR